MPEFQHYAQLDEALVIVRDVAEAHRLKLIPEKPRLVEPQLETYDRVLPEVVDRLRQFGVLELEGSFTVHSLHFKRRGGGVAQGTYYVDESIGPRLRWMLPGLHADKELTPGTIGYLRQYLNPETQQWEPASNALKSAFKQIVTAMKQHMVVLQVRRGEKVWVGRDSKRLIDEGKLSLER